ncbi:MULTISPECIES: RNA polymerase sigma factor [Nostoc]|uniref:Sigma-70 family RNA polymerase sigma factor n=2 Tax=Nostoc TaxID=1177 RepID=A0ABR8IB69_9NOSO|nr:MULTISPECIES: sigma-70 family RNA polymerase sigma factor [Nostoc]MBD2562721.1 sigma-70 family RNA polymerase sigma factor [Nostoc linckia FACHB-391]MBD2648343.1 sigma-70 family RNA polymerase sigma factor [Nostoc foliaceum FACHB-393]
MINRSNSLQLNDAGLDMPDASINHSIASTNILHNVLEETIQLRQTAQCDVYEGLRLRTDFWLLWQQYRDYHYSRCLQWMGGDRNDAEDSLSLAMLKAWKKWPDYAGKMTNPKAWLTRLIHNLCMDIHRKRKRSEQSIENIEDIKFADGVEVTSSIESPELDISRREMRAYLYQTIEALPPRLRDPFILRYCKDKPYKDIANQLVLSEENVYKRVQQARTILRKQLNKYLAGEDDTSLDYRQPRKWVISPVEESKRDETIISEWEAAIATQSIVEQINYKLTAICLTTLPHSWYSSPNPLAWR